MRIALLLLLLGCCPLPRVELVGSQGDACSRACAKLSSLGCKEGSPTPGGISCYDVCMRVELEGIELASPCVLASQSCDEARACVQ